MEICTPARNIKTIQLSMNRDRTLGGLGDAMLRDLDIAMDRDLADVVQTGLSVAMMRHLSIALLRDMKRRIVL